MDINPASQDQSIANRPARTRGSGNSGSRDRGAPLPLPENLTYTSCYCEENVYFLAEQFERTLEAERWPWEVYVVFISNDSKTVALWNQRSSKRPEMGNVVIWDYHVVLVLRQCRAVTIQDNASSTELLERSPEAYDSSKSNGETDGADDTRGNGAQGRLTGTLDQQTCSEDKGPGDRAQSGLRTNARSDFEHGPSDSNSNSLPVAWVYDLDSCADTPCPFNEYLRRTFPYSSVLGDSAGGWELPESFVSLFRVIPAAVYLDHFVSDRSHMLIEPQPTTQTHDEVSTNLSHPTGVDGPPTYSATPPSYAPLRGRKIPIEAEIRTNLMASFVSMQGRSRQRLMQFSHFEATDAHHVSTTSNDEGVRCMSHDVEPEFPKSVSLQEFHGPGGHEAEEYGEVMDLREFLIWGGLR